LTAAIDAFVKGTPCHLRAAKSQSKLGKHALSSAAKVAVGLSIDYRKRETAVDFSLSLSLSLSLCFFVSVSVFSWRDARSADDRRYVRSRRIRGILRYTAIEPILSPVASKSKAEASEKIGDRSPFPTSPGDSNRIASESIIDKATGR